MCKSLKGFTPAFYDSYKKVKRKGNQDIYLSTVNKFWALKSFGMAYYEMDNRELELLFEAEQVYSAWKEFTAKQAEHQAKTRK